MKTKQKEYNKNYYNRIASQKMRKQKLKADSTLFRVMSHVNQLAAPHVQKDVTGIYTPSEDVIIFSYRSYC